MANKNELLQNILEDLGQGETEALSKMAEVKTENIKVPSMPIEHPKSSTRPLGLSGLLAGQNGKTEHLSNPTEGLTSLLGKNKRTENIDTPKMKREPWMTTLEKKASIIESLSTAVGFDLSKTASEDTLEDTLLKVAEETMHNFEQDLEKTALLIADSMADRFLERINGVY